MSDSGTVRLYYTNSYQTAFDATVVSTQHWEDKPAVVLDRTCFYPTSGGQAHDTGALANCRVLDVIANADGSVLHVLDREIEAGVGETVRGKIDWSRRYDHMQQHSGQHLLSHVFHEQFGMETVSVHFGAAESTLDLQVDAVTPEQMVTAERRANELVYANLPFKAYFVDDEAIRALPLRRPPQVQGKIRIVEMDGLDYVACGGTHCHRTGELGPIKLVRQERSRGNVRITFLCGWRAQEDYATKHDLIADVAGRFSTEAAAIPSAIERLHEQERVLQKEVADLRNRLLHLQAAELREQAEALGEYALVRRIFSQEPPEVVKQLAQQLQQQPRLVAVLGATAGGQMTLFVARGEEVPLHAGQLVRVALQKFSGGGGGRPEFAQGGGLSDEMANQFMVHISQLINSELQAEAKN